MSKAAALVLGAGYNAHGLARSCRQASIPCYGFDALRHSPLQWSRLFAARRSATPGATFEQQRAELLLFARSLAEPLVLFTTDERWTVDALTSPDEYQAAGIVTPCRHGAASLLCIDKVAFSDWCGKHGIPTTVSLHFRAGSGWGEFCSKLDEMRFPIIVKPATKGNEQQTLGFSFYQLFDVPGQLRRWLDTLPPEGPAADLIAEQYIEGPVSNLVSLQGYAASGGVVHASQYRKLAQTQGRIGCSNVALIEPVDGQLLETTREILARLDFHGLFDIEFKTAVDEAQSYLIEINPRAGMLNFAAARMGVNLPALAIDDLGYKVAAARRRDGPPPAWIWCNHLAHSIEAIRSGRQNGRKGWIRSAAAQWREPLRGATIVDPMLTWSDPGPIARSAANLMAKAVSHLSERVKKRWSWQPSQFDATPNANA